jgi:hypothetical protein
VGNRKDHKTLQSTPRPHPPVQKIKMIKMKQMTRRWNYRSPSTILSSIIKQVHKDKSFSLER